jgi:uncharacterized protein YqfA (UPF0365 family)
MEMIDTILLWSGLVAVGIPVLILLVAMLYLAPIWVQAFVSGADVSLMSLVGMSLRKVNTGIVVKAKIMGRQAGLEIDRAHGLSTARLEAHYLAGGDVQRVLLAIIAARNANIDLNFDRAMAIDLAGRDVLDAVRTSIVPKVIDCPEAFAEGDAALGAVARNGVELRVRARVTVRTNLDQLIGGATEKTIIARVGQGIIAAIGSADSHMDVMENPDKISKGVLECGLDNNTAFEIISIDIVEIDVRENIGARLQIVQADADMKIAQAGAEARRATAVALWQEMKAEVAGNVAAKVLAEAQLPSAIAFAIRAGQLHYKHPSRSAERKLDLQGRETAVGTNPFVSQRNSQIGGVPTPRVGQDPLGI